MCLNKEIKLSLEDYKNHIEPIIMEHQKRKDLLCIFLKKNYSANNQKEQEVYLLFYMILSFYVHVDNLLDADKNKKRNPYEPSIEHPNGASSGSPDDIPKNHQEFLQSIVEEISLPWVRARVADVLWITWERDKPKNANFAVTAYIVALEKQLTASMQEPIENERTVEYVQRILYLSNFSEDKSQHQVLVIEKLKNFLMLHKEPIILHFFCKSVSLIIDYVKRKSNCDEDLLNGLASLMDIVKERVHGSDDPYDHEELSKIYNKLGDQQEAKNCTKTRAELYEQKGLFVQDFDPMSATVAYSESLKICPGAPETNSRRSKINTKLSEASSKSLEKMQKTYFLTPDNSKSAERIKSEVSGLPFLEALERLVLYLPCPSRRELEEGVQEEKDNIFSPWFDIVNQHKISTVNDQARFESINSDNAQEDIAFYFTRNYFAALMIDLVPILEVLKWVRQEHFNINENDWSGLLQKCSLIPQKRLQSYQLGLHNWFSGKNCIALSMLIPQLENSIRFLIQTKQQDTSIFRTRQTRQEEKPFDTNLDNEIIKNLIGEDFVILLKIFLTEKNGFTLRHKVAHGLMDDSDFRSAEVEYCVLLWLKMIFLFSKMPI